jgi:hypothetical protein
MPRGAYFFSEIVSTDVAMLTVRVAGQPIRASRESALWCALCIEQLWRARGRAIAAAERETAHQTFLRAIEAYRKIAAEAAEGGKSPQ